MTMELYSFTIEFSDGEKVSYYNVEGPIEKIYSEFWGQDDVVSIHFE